MHGYLEEKWPWYEITDITTTALGRASGGIKGLKILWMTVWGGERYDTEGCSLPNNIQHYGVRSGKNSSSGSLMASGVTAQVWLDGW